MTQIEFEPGRLAEMTVRNFEISERRVCEAMHVDGGCIKDAPLYVWLGPGGDWEYNSKTKGVTLCPGDRAIEALPGDWIIKLPDGSLTIARGV